MEITYTQSSNKLPNKPKNGDHCAVFELEEENLTLFLLADGVGGCVGDYKASTTSVNQFYKNFQENLSEINIQERITKAINKVNEAILLEVGYYKGMKSTFVACILDKTNEKLYYTSIGDSRLYSIRSKEVKKLTKDQTKVVIRRKQDGTPLTQNGSIINAEGVTNVLGAKPLNFQIKNIQIEETTSYLIATDGFYSRLYEDGKDLIQINNSLSIDYPFQNLVKKVTQEQDDDATAIFFRVALANDSIELQKQQLICDSLIDAIKNKDVSKALISFDKIEEMKIEQSFYFYDNAIKLMRKVNFNNGEIYQKLVIFLKKARK